MASVHQLPAELLIHIFSCLTQSFPSWKEYRVLDRHRFVLCVVCSRWRDITISTPALWASIYIGRVSDDQINPFPSLDVFKLCLERSGNIAPLAICLHECPQPFLGQTWAILYPHFHRIGDIMIVARSRDDLFKLLPIPYAPALKSLTCHEIIQESSQGRLIFKSDLVTDERGLPSLRSLDVENIPFRSLFKIPVGQLTALRLSVPTSLTTIAPLSIEWNEVFDILRQCVSLVDLHANLVGSARDGFPTEIIDLPKLERLTIYHPHLASHLQTPRLECIHAFNGGVVCDPQQPLPCLRMYIAEVGYHGLRGWCVPKSFATLEQLHFIECGRSAVRNVLARLAESASSGDDRMPLFPRLQTLRLSRLAVFPRSDVGLTAVIFKLLDAMPSLRIECVRGELFLYGLTHGQHEKYAHRLLPPTSTSGGPYSHEDHDMI
ncbi:hypothetical protein DL93DRAFT_1751843 [Clavulina sp. PMI_390]|nr:hypothetical protein DL93DRAFT_1751843 [Clavulina sp. PMI_390]